MKPQDDKTLTARYLVRAAANLGRLREALQKYKDRTTALFPVVSEELKVDLEIVLHRAETALNEEETRIGTRTAELFDRKPPRPKARPEEGVVWEHTTTLLAYLVKDGALCNPRHKPPVIPVVFEPPPEMGYREVDVTKVPPRNSKWYDRETGAVIMVENADAGVVDYRTLQGGKRIPPTVTASLKNFHLAFRPDLNAEKLRALIVRGSMWKARPQAAEEFARLTVTVQGYSPSEDCVSFRAGGSNPVTYGVTCESFLDNFRPIRPGAA